MLGPRTRFLVLSRDSFTCRYCGKKPPDVKLHVDHVQAKANGGKDELDNYITACSDCNIGKGTIEIIDSTITLADANMLWQSLQKSQNYRQSMFSMAIMAEFMEYLTSEGLTKKRVQPKDLDTWSHLFAKIWKNGYDIGLREGQKDVLSYIANRLLDSHISLLQLSKDTNIDFFEEIHA